MSNPHNIISVLDPDYAIPKDCLELLLTGTTRSGVYSIDPDGMGAVQVIFFLSLAANIQ